MEFAEYLRFVFALIFVIGLIGGTAFLARRFGFAPGAATGGSAHAKRLEIVESLALDPKRRMLLVRRDGKEHLILLGLESETLIEGGIDRPAAPAGDDADAHTGLPVPARTTMPHPAAKPSADDDIFARLRKVADLMHESRAFARRTGKPRHAAPAPLRKAAGDHP